MRVNSHICHARRGGSEHRSCTEHLSNGGERVRGGKRAGMGRVVEISVLLGAYKHLGSKNRVSGPRSSDR